MILRQSFASKLCRAPATCEHSEGKIIFKISQLLVEKLTKTYYQITEITKKVEGVWHPHIARNFCYRLISLNLNGINYELF